VESCVEVSIQVQVPENSTIADDLEKSLALKVQVPKNIRYVLSKSTVLGRKRHTSGHLHWTGLSGQLNVPNGGQRHSPILDLLSTSTGDVQHNCLLKHCWHVL
jgi:hypothetical protein